MRTGGFFSCGLFIVRAVVATPHILLWRPHRLGEALD